MKALTTQPNALRVALSPATPRASPTASQLPPGIYGLAPLKFPAPPPDTTTAYRTRSGGHTSRSRATSTANAAQFYGQYGLLSCYWHR